jgi:hypothetical protein
MSLFPAWLNLPRSLPSKLLQLLGHTVATHVLVIVVEPEDVFVMQLVMYTVDIAKLSLIVAVAGAETVELLPS